MYFGTGLITAYPSREVVSLPMALGEQGGFLAQPLGSEGFAKGRLPHCVACCHILYFYFYFYFTIGNY